MLPEYSLELFCHVSAPNSPLRGMVWNAQTFFPVRTSNARMSPLGNFMDLGARPFSSDVGTTMTSWETSGGEVFMR